MIFISFNMPVACSACRGGDDDHVASFHIVDPLAGGRGIVKDGVGTSGHIGFEDGVEVTDEEEAFALSPGVGWRRGVRHGGGESGSLTHSMVKTYFS